MGVEWKETSVPRTLPDQSEGNPGARALTPAAAWVLDHQAKRAGFRIHRATMLSFPPTTPLHDAAYHGDASCMQALLRKGMSPNIRAHSPHSLGGVTALHVASKCGNVVVVHALLDGGADVDGVDDEVRKKLEIIKNEMTPLHEAAYAGHVGVVQALLAAGAVRNPLAHGEVPGIRHWPKNNEPWTDGDEQQTASDEQQMASDEQQTADDGQRTAGDEQERNKLRERWIHFYENYYSLPVQESVFTPLHLATHGNHLKAIMALLEGGADIERIGRSGETALHWACRRGLVDAVILLSSAGANMNARDERDSSPMTWAHDASTVKTLILSGANPNLKEGKNTQLWTPIGYFCANTCLTASQSEIQNTVSIIKVLIHHGADIDVKVYDALSVLNDRYPALCSLLATAALNGVVEIISVLLDAGLDPNQADERTGESALHVAASWGRIGALRLLCKAGARVDARTRRMGSTALHLACRYRREEIIHELLRWKASPTAREDGPEGLGQTPVQVIGLHFSRGPQKPSFPAILPDSTPGPSRDDNSTKSTNGRKSEDVWSISRVLHRASRWWRRGVVILLATHFALGKVTWCRFEELLQMEGGPRYWRRWIEDEQANPLWLTFLTPGERKLSRLLEELMALSMTHQDVFRSIVMFL